MTRSMYRCCALAALFSATLAGHPASSGRTDGPNWPFFLDFAAGHLN
ncbi:MAG TPA: hypothetical protein VN736_28085 [Candidatus Limnocylindrales bacterium]|nr:hypothetical protein [Candidatus Limnocylindrales bacterium]